MRRVRSDVLKISHLLMEVRVSAGEDGSLVLSPASMGIPPQRLVEVGPDRFVSTDSPRRAVFASDDTGRVRHLFLESTAFDRNVCISPVLSSIATTPAQRRPSMRTSTTWYSSKKETSFLMHC